MDNALGITDWPPFPSKSARRHCCTSAGGGVRGVPAYAKTHWYCGHGTLDQGLDRAVQTQDGSLPKIQFFAHTSLWVRCDGRSAGSHDVECRPIRRLILFEIADYLESFNHSSRRTRRSIFCHARRVYRRVACSPLMRLLIGKTLAFGSSDRLRGAFRIGHTKRGTLVVAEIKLCQIPLQMSLRDMVIRAGDATLQD